MKKSKILAGLSAATMLATTLTALPPGLSMTASAAVSYPVQYFRLGMADTDANVNASEARLIPDAQNGTNAEKWSLNWISDGVYEIVSADSGRRCRSGESYGIRHADFLLWNSRCLILAI